MSEKIAVIYDKFKINKELLFNRLTVPSLISKTLKIEGVLRSEGVIEIEGDIKGDIYGDIVTLRETAVIKGDIEANIVNIKGDFKGKIIANRVNISQEAKIVGTINYFSLSVEEGASIEGQLKREKTKLVKESTKNLSKQDK